MGNTTKQQMLQAGHTLALKLGAVGKLTARNISETTGLYFNCVNFHYGGIKAFRAAVLAYGVEQGTMQSDQPSAEIRMDPEQRKTMILATAFSQAAAEGLATVTRASVANELGITDGLINRYFTGRTGLREAVLSKAVVDNCPDVVADAIEMGMSTQHVPPKLLEAAKEIIALG